MYRVTDRDPSFPQLCRLDCHEKMNLSDERSSREPTVVPETETPTRVSCQLISGPVTRIWQTRKHVCYTQVRLVDARKTLRLFKSCTVRLPHMDWLGVILLTLNSEIVRRDHPLWSVCDNLQWRPPYFHRSLRTRFREDLKWVTWRRETPNTKHRKPRVVRIGTHVDVRVRTLMKVV